VFPELRADLHRAIQPIKKLVQKGVQATGKVMGTRAPSAAEAERFLMQKQIPEPLIHQVIHDLGILPHMRHTSTDLDMDTTELKQIWDRRLKSAGVQDRVRRMNIMMPFVQAQIPVWMPSF